MGSLGRGRRAAAGLNAAAHSPFACAGVDRSSAFTGTTVWSICDSGGDLFASRAWTASSRPCGVKAATYSTRPTTPSSGSLAPTWDDMLRHLLLLACLAQPAAAQVGDSLLIEAPDARRVLHAADWARLPQDTMRVQFHDQPLQTYAGVSLPSLLQLVGIRTDSLRGRNLSLRVVVEAADGYRVVLSLADLDPTLGGRRTLLAHRVDGEPLPATEAPLRLLIAGDQRPSRWARQVVALRVRTEAP